MNKRELINEVLKEKRINDKNYEQKMIYALASLSERGMSKKTNKKGKKIINEK